ncbi:MAG: hypothetical protein ACOC7J_05390, partial [Armatimonadota bacterium]
MLMTARASSICIVLILLTAAAYATPLDATWAREKLAGGEWVSDDAHFAPDAEAAVIVNRGAPHHARLTAVIDADLAATPWLEVRAHASNAQWRLTGSFAGGDEIVIADRQTVGRCGRDLTELFGADGGGELRLHMHIWGWGDGSGHYVRFTPELSAEGEHSDATQLIGEMERAHAANVRRADDLSQRREGHPRLRFTEEN